MNKQHEVQLSGPGVSVTVNVLWRIEDESFDYAGTHCTHGSGGTHEVFTTMVESFDIKYVFDQETGEYASLDVVEHEDRIEEKLNDGQCSPEPPTHGDFKREAEEAEGERRAEEQREREHYGD